MDGKWEDVFPDWTDIPASMRGEATVETVQSGVKPNQADEKEGPANSSKWTPTVLNTESYVNLAFKDVEDSDVWESSKEQKTEPPTDPVEQVLDILPDMNFIILSSSDN